MENADITAKVSNIVAQQARVCAERHRAIETELARLGNVVKEQERELEVLRVEAAMTRTAQAVQAVKFGIAAAIGAAIPTVALGLLLLLANR
jgi:hypothetical protein